MHRKIFISIFNQSIHFFSDEWKNKYVELLNNEHWDIIGNRVFNFVFEDRIYHNPLPFFNEEIISNYAFHYQYFEGLKILKGENEKAQLIARIIEQTPIESLLVILGQRKTSASITDENAIPPLKEKLLESCFKPHNGQICKATRAREKHISRNPEDDLWGKIRGTPKEKKESSKAIVSKIIKEKVWWNVFTHYKHDVVYEIRIGSGEGIRWKKNELEMIGFLEPFN